MAAPIRVLQYGLGPIGLACTSTILDKARSGRVSLVGAVDIDPAKAGRDLGELLGRQRPVGVVVSADADAALADARPHVALHTTSSFLPRVERQLLRCVAYGAHVVSSTEELSFPFERHPETARRLDEAARARGTVILGTGVNPGYAMDALALFATGACTEVRSIEVERVVDASRRRGPLQRKIGAGLSLREVETRRASGTFGHIGLRESLLIVADGLGWTLDGVEESLEPILASERVVTRFVEVAKGDPAGIHQRAVGYRGGSRVIVLDLKMYVGASSAFDTVRIDGTPPIDLRMRGGVFGDTATVAALVNAIPAVMEAPPGLATVHRLRVPAAFATA